VEVFMNEAEWSSVVSAARLGDESIGVEEAKVNVALFGGVFASQPLGRELLVRFARHLGEGHKRNNTDIMELFSRIYLYILPMVDADHFDLKQAGKCDLRLPRRSLGYRFEDTGQRMAPAVKAVKTFLDTHDIEAALSLESGGLFIRLPWDSKDKERGSGSSKGDPALKYLGDAYLKASKRLSNVTEGSCDVASPHGLAYGSSSVTYNSGGTILDFMYGHGLTAAAAHVSCCSFPPAEDLPKLWMENLDPLKAFVSAAGQGVYGQVCSVPSIFVDQRFDKSLLCR
jgi:carboxypeptidase D